VDPLLRPATADDVDALARVWHQGWWDAHPYFAPQLGAWRTLESFRERIAERVPTTTVAVVDGAVVGLAVLKHDELEQLFVDRSARGTGVAQRLIADAERRIAASGFPLIWLAVATENAPALRFYDKCGWSKKAAFEYQAETPNGPVPVPCYRYERRFEED
jgi:ribosomal protein S18 acetylase RimI-like enzyme